MKRYGMMGVLGLMVAIMTACGSSNSHNPSPPPSPANGKVLFAVYMVGSDLETNGDFATGDLLDMIDGYAQLDAVGKESLEVLVAFGGSLKPTWNGVRYADMGCLTQDGMDGVFGNDHCYSYEAVFARANPNDMSDKYTLIHFLTTVKAMAPDYETVFVNLWNHGGGYSGYGNDENFDLKNLSVAQVAEAFEITGLRPNIIGFDACLMASAEVYAQLYPHADYLVGSQELEPGHGWDYSLLLPAFTADAQEFARRAVDTFIDSEQHIGTSGKTLSVVDTSFYPAFLASLDDLAVDLYAHVDDQFVKLVKAVYSTEKYSGYRVDYAMDLKHFLDLYWSLLNPQLDAQIITKINAVRVDLARTVVYSRQDRSRPNAHGLSVFAFDNNLWDNGGYQEDNSISKQWYAFVEVLITHDDEDIHPPQVVPADIEYCGKTTGRCYWISDDFAVKSAYGVLALETANPNEYEMLMTRPLERISADYFYLEDFNRDVLTVCDTVNGCAYAYAQTHLAGDQFQFQGVVDLLYSNISVRFSGGKYIDHWVSGQYDPEFGTHGKDDGFIQPGDRLIPFRQIVSYDEDEAGGWEQDYEIEGSTVLNFTAPPLFALEPGPAAGLEFLVVHDAQDNIGLYDTSGNPVPIVR
jgi:hypothetical protein